MSRESDRFDLTQALADRLLRGQPTALLVHGILGAAAIAFLWSTAPRTLVVGWASALALAIAARGIGYRVMTRRPAAPDAVIQRLRLLIVGTGVAWGAGVALLTSDLTVPQWALLLTVLAGLVSPAMTTIDADPVAFRLFLVATMGPLPVAVFSQGIQREHVFALFLIPVFAAFTWLINGRLHTMLVQHLLVASRLAASEEQARRATAAKAAFLASMSHEIRTPLNGVIGMTELLLDTPLSTTQRDYAETVRRSADSLLLIINDILDYSKIEAGELRLEEAPFDLEVALKDVADLVGAAARARGLELALRIVPGTPRHVIGDVTRLRQVLTNLVGNAVKFTHEGHVLMEVAALGGGGRIPFRFSVEDTGIGIPAHKQQHIFERFTQAEASTTRRYGGTGLGLAISKQIVGRMGGSLTVESTLGQGSTFRFTVELPVMEGAAEGIGGSLAGIRALIVDDREVNRRILAEQLTGWGLRTDAVSTVAEAVDALRRARQASDPYGVGVLDYQLPDGDGLGLARELRLDQAFRDLVLVIVSSIGDRPDDEAGGEVDSWLVKPARPSALYNALMDGLARRAGRAAPRAAPARMPERQATRPRLAGRVLVAEDNVVNQKVIVTLLEKLGCRADLASNGREAVDQIERFPYDVILMDCEMPEMDGFAATAEIRRRETGTGHRVPIVALTAYAMTGDRERCLAAGMDEYLSKPVREPELIAALKAHLSMVPAGPAPALAAEATPPTPVLLPEIADDPDLMREIVDLYRSNAPGWMDQIRQALAARDGTGLARAAHTLRGAVSHLGVPAATDATRALEDAGRAADFAAAPKTLARLETELRHLDDALITLRASLA